MIESARGIAWIIAVLEADNAVTAALPGGLWRTVAPQQGVTVSYPLGVVQFQGGKDITGSNQVRLWNDGVYVVKVIGEGDQDDAIIAAADAIDTALQNQRGTAQGGTILVALREQSVGPLDEIVDGTRFTTVGGSYNLLVTAL